MLIFKGAVAAALWVYFGGAFIYADWLWADSETSRTIALLMWVLMWVLIACYEEAKSGRR